MESEETSGLSDVLTLRSCGTRQNQETDGIRKIRMTK